MVLAHALEEARHQLIDDHEGEGVYLFAYHFPDYDDRMEAIAVAARMAMQWPTDWELA